MQKLSAFHGDPKLKAMIIKEIKWHQKQDKIAQGSYGSNNSDSKYCAVGCSIRTLNVKLGKDYSYGDHSVYPKELGIPQIIAKLEDRIFERLPREEALKFPLKFMTAIPVGADLEMVWPKFAVWLLVDKKDGVIKFAKNDRTKKSIQDVADLYQRKINGEEIDINQWLKVRNAAAAADAAAAAAAAAAADAAAAAADAAADAAAYAAADVAYVAAAVDAAHAAHAAHAAAHAAHAHAHATANAAYVTIAADDAAAATAYAADATTAHADARKKQAKKLLELLKSAPILKQ